ncbi:MAG: tRNA (adenosine(37)-N6)-threonylcarbamoyltransferase complex dimerization subunit type 1 TsaB [Microthrixaceae bacterium]
MLILGIDTATRQAGCAIGGHEGVLALAQFGRGRRHAENLAPSIDFLCRHAQVTLGDIGAVAVDVGPGLFTGLRVGIATAKALAHALGVPMVGVSSLDLLAFAVRFSPRLIVAAIDARRGELFWATYRQVPGGVQRLDDPTVGPPEELAALLAARRDEMLLVGDGIERYRSTFEDLPHKVEMADAALAHPSAGSLVTLAHAQALREQFVGVADLEPVYLRRPDAEVNWQVRETV